ncbi:NCS1 family nucleobase:cation symporter-1 [Paracoccus fistulariae]|uniref:NCS1 family nucleobase:cation symporter-1 n=1 Tax=Paracoccus fistulariae TaxID=658446 RepID=A0ABY7SM00_9RHOB|nr:NCS1 family nucleobase:cation symporter-1 [Paracoccus fistulariae]MDB6179806.1 NCS1 family nucleobase:cation symporter-1 [Paracoccus fistulariae]WCR07914.1 NCS1 family nucleobase:cation symporter-1 [Paracoccus fistulariae]
MQPPHTGQVTGGDSSLYNEDLAPIPQEKRSWGAFEIFNVWNNDIQSLFGYTLAASLFLSYGLNGWLTFAAIVLSGVLVMWLVNLSGRPSVRYGIPYAVMARASMGVRGARFPALIRGIVAIFWYGVQTYFASTAVALALRALFGIEMTGDGAGGFLGLGGVDWIAYIIVAGFQIGLFLMGIEWVGKFLNWAGPFVYLVMIALALMIWWQAGNGIWTEIGTIFQGGDSDRSTIAGFVAVVGTMVAYFAAVVINFGDFSRFVKTEAQMRKGNFWGLPVSMAFFSFIALFITAGAVVLFGERLTDPTQIVARVDNLGLTLLAALTFFAATVGINLVANFIPAAYDISNMAPDRISAKQGGLITAAIAFVIGALWVSLISKIGIAGFVDTLGAILAPLYGILIADYYIVQKRELALPDLFSADPQGRYHYEQGWNKRALLAVGLAALFSVGTVWLPALQALSGFGWLIGAVLGGVLYISFTKRH